MGWIQQGATVQWNRPRACRPFRATWNWWTTMLRLIPRSFPLHALQQGWFPSRLLQGTNLWHQRPFGMLRGSTTCTSWYLSGRDDHSRIIWKVNNAILNSINLTYHVNSVKSVCTMYSSYFLHMQQSIRDRVLWSEIESWFLGSNLGQTWTNPWTKPKKCSNVLPYRAKVAFGDKVLHLADDSK